jgi:hypothetical protein
MRPRLLAVFIVGLICLVGTQARAESEIVVAIRYLQAEGTSHAHLYLFREDGKLLRQLTNDNSGQDVEPIFASDGATIVFTREKPNNVRDTWTIDPSGQVAKKLEAAPDWYTATKSSPYFTNIELQESTSTTAAPSPAVRPVPTYKSPDGSFELAIRLDPKDEDDQINGPGHGKHYLLRDLKTGTETEFGKLPGFYGVAGLLHDSQNRDQYFLFSGALRLAFFDLHLNSTDGDTFFALDLSGPRLVTLLGEVAFLTFTENRYVPIPGSKKTANCSYMERWDEKLSKIRYAREKSAALCYGASMYRPDKDPHVITLRRGAD